MKLYDISPPISPAIAVWPGDSNFSFHWKMAMREGDSCNVATITLSTHTGAHTDAPCHFQEGAPGIDQVPLEPYVGPATVVEAFTQEVVEMADLSHLNVDRIERLLLKTSRSTDANRFPQPFASISPEVATFLTTTSIRLVGIDTPSVDAFHSKKLPTHNILLKGRIAILEGIDLSVVPAGDYELIALPLKLSGLDASPVRAILRELNRK